MCRGFLSSFQVLMSTRKYSTGKEPPKRSRPKIPELGRVHVPTVKLEKPDHEQGYQVDSGGFCFSCGEK